MSKVVRKIVLTPDAAPPGGPYSQAVVAGNMLFLSGQIGRDVDGKLLEGIEAQTHQCLKNLQAVARAAGPGIDLKNIVKVTVLLTDISNWPRSNAVYKQYFPERPPARVAYAVKDLPMGALIEIDAQAILADIDDQ